ncbi:hypothetical protein IKP85_01150 [bacterium]|nr:hypothetical protein [bacterium]
MAKSLNELGETLKAIIKDMNSDTRGFRVERYNNLKITMNPEKESRPHVAITIGMSEALYSIDTQIKVNGSLGPDERYVAKWFGRAGVIDSLKDVWRENLVKIKKSQTNAHLPHKEDDSEDSSDT